MIGQQLGNLIDQLRNECGDSVSPAQGAAELPALIHLLNRVQETLYDDFTWEHLKIWRDHAMQAAERYYSFDPDLSFERIVEAFANYSNAWLPLTYGIRATDYNSSNPDTGSMTDPPLRWAHYENNQFEIWPTPSGQQAIRVRFYGIKRLQKMSNLSDRAIIDDTLIVLVAASERLMRSKQADAVAKQGMAQKRLNTLRGRSLKTTSFTINGGLRDRNWHDYKIRIKEPDMGL